MNSKKYIFDDPYADPGKHNTCVEICSDGTFELKPKPFYVGSFEDPHKCNTRMKVYPDGSFISCTANKQWLIRPEFRQQMKEIRAAEKAKYLERSERIRADAIGWAKHLDPSFEPVKYEPEPEPALSPLLEELLERAREFGISVNGTVEKPNAPKKANIRRARDKIFDLIYLNPFEYFATFTFNPKKKDSFDVESVMKTVKKWLHNHQERNGLKYIMVPEYHKSGRIHLHMLYSGSLKLKFSGKYTKSGAEIFNCKSWRYGFSTVIPCDSNRAKLAFYVSKYITKDVHKIFGKYYYSSQGLIRSPDIVYTNRNYKAIQAPVVHVDSIDVNFKYESSFTFNSDSDDSTALLRSLGLEALE